ncbi:MAG: ABC transporter permease [Oscillospiraceae bacterium]
MTHKKTDSLNEALKNKEAEARERMLTEVDNNGETILALDDTQRVKVLSPGRLVTKRFFRNKLAMIGLVVLIFMFVFAFLCPLFYPYSQTEVFHKYDYLNIDYAIASERRENVSYVVGDGLDVSSAVANRMNSYILELEAAGVTEMPIYNKDDGSEYVLAKLGDNVYTLSANDLQDIGVYYTSAAVTSYDRLLNKFSASLGEDFETAVRDTLAASDTEFTLDGTSYEIVSSKKHKYTVNRTTPTMEYADEDLGEAFAATVGRHLDGSFFEQDGITYRVRPVSSASYSVSSTGGKTEALVASTYVFNSAEPSAAYSDSFKAEALMALYSEDGSFTADGKDWHIKSENGDITVYDDANAVVSTLSTFVVRRYSGQDTLSLEFKDTVQGVIEEMQKTNAKKGNFNFNLPEIDQDGNYIVDENGQPIYADTEITVNLNSTNSQYVLNCEQITLLIDRYARSSAEHWAGTDGDGMDILSRMMYGGRISLMVGFVVVILQTILGVITGGLAGFFGGWVDTLIMRLVDVFYCIPTYPILIIMGAFFDSIKMDPYTRIMWLMAILGVLGWAGIARLVRGQILSLREQEFMVAEEATGMKASRRIFRHLVPNVMPQLIVNATMGLGSVIITESTLSFLGLGVKHPLATWGTMINSVTASSENMIKYTYIWVPVGLLICLTVIAFNFVGDGLRDAFDPKMKQ